MVTKNAAEGNQARQDKTQRPATRAIWLCTVRIGVKVGRGRRMNSSGGTEATRAPAHWKGEETDVNRYVRKMGVWDGGGWGRGADR